MTEEIIRVENVSKLYRLGVISSSTLRDDIKKLFSKATQEKQNTEDMWALRDISFSVNKGEVVGIIGKNGAGKSTLLKILSRITSPTSGELKVKGRIASLLEVGTGFHPELTGRENIFLNGAILGMKKNEIQSKLDEIIEFSGVSKYIDTPVKRYSSGMYVRLAFAVAAHLEPEILIVDEVLAVGDVEFQNKCLGKMKDVSGQGRTVLFVSHNMSAVKTLCSRGILLEHGKVKVAGSVADVVDAYFVENRTVSETGIIPDDFYRPYGTGEARFKSVYACNLNGSKTKEFRFTEAFKIRFEFEVKEDIKNAILIFNLNNAAHEAVVNSAEFKERYMPRDYTKGTYLVEALLNTRLMPGRFTIDASLAYFQSGSTIDVAQSVYEFTVSSIGKNNGGDYPWTTIHGYVLADTQWDYKKLND